MAAKKPNLSKPKSTTPITPAAPAAQTPVAPATTPAAAVAPAATTAVIAPAATPAPAATVAVATPERDRSGVVAIIAKLHHVDADIARDAAVTLGTLPANADSVSALIAVLLDADRFFHPVVRAAAAASLGKLRDPRAFEALLHATRDPMAETSDEAVKALGHLRDRRALPMLKAIVRNSDNFYLANVQASAEVALKQIGE
ncbi:MAG TPA: HEAT repeat domain-containing protein [Phycisphaerae bacterium]|nr:HEAT repeat domain-containing protein [Phycisphaerae bacterium]